MPEKTFSTQLRRVREAAGISLRDLAARTPGLPYSKLSLLERGLSPRPNEVRLLAAALGAAVAEEIERSGGQHAA